MLHFRKAGPTTESTEHCRGAAWLNRECVDRLSHVSETLEQRRNVLISAGVGCYSEPPRRNDFTKRSLLTQPPPKAHGTTRKFGASGAHVGLAGLSHSRLQVWHHLQVRYGQWRPMRSRQRAGTNYDSWLNEALHFDDHDAQTNLRTFTWYFQLRTNCASDPGLRDGASTNAPYMYLSHVWDSTPHFMLSQDDLEDLKILKRLSNLPKSFQDASAVPRHPSIGYLRIDAIDITPNQTTARNQEVGRMYGTYFKAKRTIVIASVNPTVPTHLVPRSRSSLRPEDRFAQTLWFKDGFASGSFGSGSQMGNDSSLAKRTPTDHPKATNGSIDGLIAKSAFVSQPTSRLIKEMVMATKDLIVDSSERSMASIQSPTPRTDHSPLLSGLGAHSTLAYKTEKSSCRTSPVQHTVAAAAGASSLMTTKDKHATSFGQLPEPRPAARIRSFLRDDVSHLQVYLRSPVEMGYRRIERQSVIRNEAATII
jgi:hypothetical protein